MRSQLGVSFTNSVAYVSHVDTESGVFVVNTFPLTIPVNSFFENYIASEDRQIAEVANEFKKQFTQLKLAEVDAHIVVPDDMCSVQILRLPMVSEKEILSVIEFQAEEFIPYPIKNTSFDYQVLSVDDKEKKMSVLVVASLTNVVNKIADIVLESGLYPASIEPESAVLYRLLFENYCYHQSGLTLLLNIGDKNTQASLLDMKNKQLIMTHNFNLGNNFFMKALQYNLNLSSQETAEKLATLSIQDEVYVKVIKPLMTEYGKELDKIVKASQEKLSLSPQLVLVNSNDKTNALVSFLQESQIVPGAPAAPMSFVTGKESKIKFNTAYDTKKLSLYITSIGSVT